MPAQIEQTSPSFESMGFIPSWDTVEFTCSGLSTHGSRRYSATLSGLRLSCDEVESALVGPLVDELDIDYDLSDLRRGLQEYGVNGLVTKNAAPMGREVRSSLKQMIPDIRSTVNLLEEEATQETFTMPVRIAEDDRQASLYTRERLATMKPSALIRLCSEIGAPIDEDGLYRLKGSDSENTEIRMYHIDELGSDSVKLRDHLLVQIFRRIDLLSEVGVEVGFVHKQDILEHPQSPRWLQDVQIGALKKPLPSRDSLPQWEVTFREGAVAHRRVVPVIGWVTNGEDWPYRSYDECYKRPDFRGGSVHFDEQSRTLTHYSTLIGAVLLSQSIETKGDIARQAYKFFGQGFDPHEANRNRIRHDVQPLPSTVVAALPAVIVSNRHNLLGNDDFKAIEDCLWRDFFRARLATKPTRI